MQFIGTRGGKTVSGAEAAVRGIAEDGGLFVPCSFPAVSAEELGAMLGMDYPERAAFILGKFYEEYDKEGLLAALESAFARFEGEDPAPLVRTDEGLYLLELFRGPTCSFKDLVLPAVAYLFREGKKLCGIREDLLVLSAGEGDTCKAVLDTFCGAEGIKAIAFYPEDGVSKMQKLQICTQEGENLNAVGVRGNPDECRTHAAKIFLPTREKLLSKGYLLTTADSVNFAHIAAQIAYVFSAYLDLVGSDQLSEGERADFAVPAGNFSNLLAVYYAKKMGLPVGKILFACNKNNAASELWKTGVFETRRTAFSTMSPSLDNLLPANLERLLFELTERDVEKTKERMGQFSSGRIRLSSVELSRLKTHFSGGCTSEDDTVDCVYEFFTEYGYPLDTQGGVVMHVLEEYRKNLRDEFQDVPPAVVLLTASPYKFPQDVLYALTGNDVKDSYKGVKRINLLTAMKVPAPIKDVRYKPVLFKTVISPDKIAGEIEKFIG